MAERDGDGFAGQRVCVDGAEVGAAEVFVEVGAADADVRGADLTFFSQSTDNEVKLQAPAIEGRV